MRPLEIFLIAWSLLICPAARAAGADLKEETALAFERYVAEATQMFIERTRTGATSSGRTRSPGDGEVIAHPGRQDGIIAVPGGLLHHWIGATFIRGITLEDALKVSYAYSDYHSFYKAVITSQLLGRDGDTYRILLRIRGSGGGLSAVLDVRARVEYFFPDSRNAYSVSRSEEIREIRNPGSQSERQLPAGVDNGYLWRAATLNRFIEREDGLFIEMETLGLSRSFPAMLGWIIEPIARRLGRRSVELSLQEFRNAVRSRQR